MAVSILGNPRCALYSKVYLEDNIFRAGAIFLVTDFYQKRKKGDLLPHMYYDGVVIPLQSNRQYPVLMEHIKTAKDVDPFLRQCLTTRRDGGLILMQYATTREGVEDEVLSPLRKYLITHLDENKVKKIEGMNIDAIIDTEKKLVSLRGKILGLTEAQIEKINNFNIDEVLAEIAVAEEADQTP